VRLSHVQARVVAQVVVDEHLSSVQLEEFPEQGLAGGVVEEASHRNTEGKHSLAVQEEDNQGIEDVHRMRFAEDKRHVFLELLQ